MSEIRTWKKAYISDLSNICTELKEVVEPASVIILDGPVGAGKTTFTKIFLGEEKASSSPTYSIVNEVDNMLHADLYRIEKKEDLLHLELPMYMEEKDYFLVEWGMPYQRELMRIIGDEFKYYKLEIQINDNDSRNFILKKLD